jgi:hypothetical protein
MLDIDRVVPSATPETDTKLLLPPIFSFGAVLSALYELY